MSQSHTAAFTSSIEKGLTKLEVIHPRPIHANRLKVRSKMREHSLTNRVHALRGRPIHLQRGNSISPPTTR
ncbi:hypothetical protein A2U01_0058896 [Trifolium medium]|uniref:Uncharacterized protein n=1 Tax=Trifolium medium TaxID=97028 RepID=A0A392RN87_9FABA|nr:hypothetical protein [Trifolium medium]